MLFLKFGIEFKNIEKIANYLKNQPNTVTRIQKLIGFLALTIIAAKTTRFRVFFVFVKCNEYDTIYIFFSAEFVCEPKIGIISDSQLPTRMSGAQARIAELEMPKTQTDTVLNADHGPPRFITHLQV
jgi:hypothetical protein